MTGSLTKHATICILLENWEYIHDPCTSPLDSPGNGDGTPHMPRRASHPSVLELSRCLTQLRTIDRRTYNHVRGYYDAPTKITRQSRLRRDRQTGKLETLNQDHTIRVIPPWVDKATASLGAQALTLAFRGHAELPLELRADLTTPYAA